MLSIIIPAYNAEKTISRCLNSILNQKNCNYEIIIVNDLSTDDTSKILDEYKSNYKNIKVIDKKIKTSISDVRNYGISQAQGEYITFVDADDTLTSDKFFYSECLSLISQYDSDALFFGYNIIEGEKVIPCPIIYEEKGGICLKASKDEIHNSIASYHPYDVNGYIWKAIFKKTEILIPIGLLSYEDMLYLHIFTKNHDNFLIYNKIGYNYYINSNSFVHQKDEYKSTLKDSSSIIVHRIISNIFKEYSVVNNISQKTIKQCSYFAFLHARKLNDKSVLKNRRKELINSIFRNKQKQGDTINLVINLLDCNKLYLATIYSLMSQRYNNFKLYIVSSSAYYKNNLSFDERIIVLDNINKAPKDSIDIKPNMIFSYNSLYKYSKLLKRKDHIAIKLISSNLENQKFLFPLLSFDDEKLELKEVFFN